MYFKVVFVVIHRRGIDASKKNERGEDRTRDLRFRRPTQYPLLMLLFSFAVCYTKITNLCHTPLLYSWEFFFPCGILNSEIRVQKNNSQQVYETLNF